jgi:hypothetical protein
MGLLWNKKVLKELNKDVFPADLRNYRELYLVSRRAIVYDLIFNHSIYNPLQAGLIILYTYYARKIEDRVRGEGDSVSLRELLRDNGLKLLQMRGLVSLASVLSEYWLSLLALEKGREGLGLSNGAKRVLLLKEMLLTIGWHSYLLKTIHQHYPGIQPGQQ